MKLDVDALGPMTVLDERGTAVELRTLWRDRPAVLVWLRHFGWLFCREQVAGFRSRQAELKDLGVTLAFVGNGTPAMLEDFKTSLGLDVPAFTDPSRRTYAHLGFRRGLVSAISPQVIASAFRAWRAGFRQTATQGDPVQQGGVVVVRTGGKAEYGFASEAAGHHPPIDEVVAAARRAAGKA